MYQKILVPVDLNEKGFSDQAVDVAVWHAKTNGAELHLLNVVPGVHMPMISSYFPQEAADKLKQEVEEKLKAFAERHVGDATDYRLHVAEGRPYTTILEYCRQLGADLIVMPSHKRSKVDRVLLGSVASKVVEHSPVDVLVIKPKKFQDKVKMLS